MRTRIALTLGTALSLGACAAGPDYRPPETASLGVPAAYTAQQGAPVSPEQLASWWSVFNEPALDTLIDAAITNNLDIAQGAARLRQARESLVQSRASFLPQVSASGGAGRNFDQGRADSSSYSIGADASWQLDLFGGIASSVEASRADLATSGYDLASIRTAIIAETATNYIQLRQQQERLRIARETLATQQENYDIAGWRVQAGLVSSLDEQQARGQLAQTTASIPTIERAIAGSLNRIAVLTGQAPGEATRSLESPTPIPTAPVQIATGIPADTLRQRPDVRASERALASATARIGVAQAALFPALGISGNIGTSALSLGGLGDIITGGLFASLAQTIFDGGARTSRVRAQEAAAEGAFAAYKSSVLGALEDVENALRYVTASEQRTAQFEIALDAANNSAILARSQYRVGLVDFQTLLNTEQSLLSARDGLASARADEALAVVQLYSALGGGWQTMDGIPQ